MAWCKDFGTSCHVKKALAWIVTDPVPCSCTCVLSDHEVLPAENRVPRLWHQKLVSLPSLQRQYGCFVN